MPSPCVNDPIHIKGDGSAEIAGIRSATWPYAGAISTNNGLAVDAVTGFGWAPPETGAATWSDSSVGPVAPTDGGEDRSGAFTGVVVTSPTGTIANSDVNRAALVIFIVSLAVDITTYGASIVSCRVNLGLAVSPSAPVTYVGTTLQTMQFLSNSNSIAIGQHPQTSFSYGYTLAAGATLNFNSTMIYQITTTDTSTKVVTASMAARAYLMHN